MKGVKGNNDTAFEYFNNLRFFENDQDRISFTNSSKAKKNIELSGTLEAFYQTVWTTYEDDVDGIENFFLKNIKRCNAQAILEDFYKWKKDNDIGRRHKDYHHRPMVPYGWMIRDP